MIRNTSRPHIEEAETTIVHDHEIADVMFGVEGTAGQSKWGRTDLIQSSYNL